MKSRKPSARTRLVNALKHLFFGGVGFLLLYLALKGQDFSAFTKVLTTADYSWAGLILVITIFNHLSRTVRWQLLLRPLGFRPALPNTFMALMFGYLVSYAVPRLGEISRCAALNEREKIPLPVGLGTVIAERVMDMLCLGVMALLALCLEWKQLWLFTDTQLSAPLRAWFSSMPIFLLASMLIVGVLAFYFLGIWLKKRFHSKGYVNKMIKFWEQLRQGLVSIFQLRQNPFFWLHTLFIWLTYILMTSLWFHAFEETSSLAISVGISMTVIGSLGRLMPIQGGGLGAYHYLFQQGMLVFGVDLIHGGALAVLIHGFQTLYYLVIGGGCTLILAILKK